MTAPDLRQVSKEGDEIVLKGSTPNAAFYEEQRIAKNDFSLFVEDAVGLLDVWDAMEAVYRELVAGTLFTEEEEVEMAE